MQWFSDPPSPPLLQGSTAAASLSSAARASTAGEHGVLAAAVLRGHVLGLEILLAGLHDGVHPAPARRVHAPPLGAGVLEPDLQAEKINR